MRLATLTLALLVTAPAAAQELRPATVRFSANVEDVHVHYMQDPVLDDARGGVAVRVAPAARYTELCVAPCDVELPQTHLGLAALRRGHLHRFTEPLGVDGPTSVNIDWDDRGFFRLAGALTLVVGGALGLAATAITLLVGMGDDVALAGGLLGSAAWLGAAVTVGLLLVLTEDSAALLVTPLPAGGAELFSDAWR